MRQPVGSPWRRADVCELHEKLITTTSMSTRDVAARIAEELGITVSRNAVISRSKRVGLTRPPEKRAMGHAPKLGKPRPEKKTQIKPVSIKVTPTAETTDPVSDYRIVNWPEPNGEDTIPLLELNGNTCRWPMASWADQPPYQYCGKPIKAGSYCGFHASVSYVRPEKFYRR